ncbi:hypothetical protein JOF56_001368 [Kibdelosporangium banguiense]|uniref:Lipoprotein n=1 Tax=Kibdelosporangium banguiense TaxID=1365924 RepID=A0ABS4T9A6_9PSEU|nr:hypothetical protein [Kibdelosporangium banguiense]MBP2320983.1 hypothetical protein [Kibdelosporangium banguiense]
MSRSRRAGVLVAALLFTTACGPRSVTPSAPVDLPAKPADFVEVFTWSQGVPEGAKPLSATFSGPHFSYQFGALATRPTMDETSGGLEGGPAKAAPGHEFLVLYRLQGDDTFAPPPEAPLTVEVVVGAARKRLPKPMQRGTGLIVSVPLGGDATLEVTDDKPYQYSIRNSNGPAPTSAPSAASRTSASSSKVRWQNGDYQAQAAYQGVRTSGPLAVTAALGERAELANELPGVGPAAAKQTWLRLPDAKINTNDADLKLDLARSFTLTLPTGTKLNARPNTSGLLFSVPEPFTGATLTISPEFPASSTAKWSTRPQSKEIPLATS